MSDRDFVPAMWFNGNRSWDDRFALDWVLAGAELYSRTIIGSRSFLSIVREVREAQRRYDNLRLDGVSDTVALELMFEEAHPDPAGMDSPRLSGESGGEAATP